jgi:hypothetical protein
MAESQTRVAGTTDSSTPASSHSGDGTTNPAAPAGTANSLGAESVRDGRPATDDDTVEAIDEGGPGITPPLA